MKKLLKIIENVGDKLSLAYLVNYMYSGMEHGGLSDKELKNSELINFIIVLTTSTNIVKK